jgi:hypothetical protein
MQDETIRQENDKEIPLADLLIRQTLGRYSPSMESASVSCEMWCTPPQAMDRQRMGGMS